MVTCEVRASYLNVFEPRETPSGDERYSVCIMVPNTEKSGLAAMNSEIQKAVSKGVEKGLFTKAQVKTLNLPLRDGTAEHKAGDRGAEFKGTQFFNASSKKQPQVVMSSAGHIVPIIDEDEIFSGCWIRADVGFFPYNKAGNRGVGAGLNSVMLVRVDERLDGRVKAEDAFDKYKEDVPEGEETGALE